MKKIILLVLAFTSLIMVRCGNIENGDGTYRVATSPNTYIIDSCEYIGYIGYGSGDIIAHKGNCRFCKERDSIKWEKRKKELEELVTKLKEK